MKKILLLMICGLFLIGVIGCSKKETSNEYNIDNIKVENNNSLVLYFSATGTTEEIAKKIKDITQSDLVEIIPENKYTKEDLNYNDDNCRANKEQKDSNIRPNIKNKIDISNYDTIYLGYPIWWGTIPKIILTLLDSYNLEEKNIILFCTSGSSGIEQSIKDIRKYNSQLNIIDGHRFSSNSSNDEIRDWIKTLNIKGDVNTMEIDKIYVKINNNFLEINLENNSSSQALVEKLKDDDLQIEMSDYGNFEKVGQLGFSLPTNDKSITTKPGDVILYQGNSITIYYDTNNWNFTKLGNIDISQDKLKNILGTGNVTATFSLDKR